MEHSPRSGSMSTPGGRCRHPALGGAHPPAHGSCAPEPSWSLGRQGASAPCCGGETPETRGWEREEQRRLAGGQRRREVIVGAQCTAPLHLSLYQRQPFAGACHLTLGGEHPLPSVGVCVSRSPLCTLPRWFGHPGRSDSRPNSGGISQRGLSSCQGSLDASSCEAFEGTELYPSSSTPRLSVRSRSHVSLLICSGCSGRLSSRYIGRLPDLHWPLETSRVPSGQRLSYRPSFVQYPLIAAS